jgi:hypothetical protein
VTDLLTAHLQRPSVQAALDDDERRVEGKGERVGTQDVLEVVVARAVVRGVREGGRRDYIAEPRLIFGQVL